MRLKKKRKLNKTMRINFLNNIIGKNCKVIDIIDYKQTTPTRIEYNLAVSVSKDDVEVVGNKYYTYDYMAKKLSEIK